MLGLIRANTAPTVTSAAVYCSWGGSMFKSSIDSIRINSTFVVLAAATADGANSGR